MKKKKKNSSAGAGENGGGEEDRESMSSSWHYPGCRKDANCGCKICVASINATLDLMPFTVQKKSSLTRLSVVTITRGGLLLYSHCKLYKSLTEEIGIWGWPLQTAGLLVTGFSSRSFTVMSGTVTEWSDGKIGYVTWEANSSWTHPKWGSSAVQLDPDTWILEYRRSPVSRGGPEAGLGGRGVLEA